MAIPKPQHPIQLCLQNLEQQRQERIMCKLRDAVLARVAAAEAGTSKPMNTADHINSGVERRLQQLIPSVYTPTHPPYASMIQRAIEELNEEGGGVSEVAISKFIKREYVDLPWAHEGLLRLHLKKQCEIGVLVLDGGRYNFNLVEDGDGGASVDVETESRRRRRPGRGRRGRGRWRGREEAERINEAFEEEGIEGGEGQDQVMGQSERPNMDEVEKALLAYIKSHNRGEANEDEMIKEQIRAGVGEDEVIKNNNQREEQQSGEEPQSQSQHDQQQQKSQEQGQVKRRPGRPKANKVGDVGTLEVVPCAPEEQPLRRRGRSKAKNDMDLGTNAEVPCAVEPPNEEQPQRRRGRSKAKHDMEASTSSLVPCALEHRQEEQPPKRRGPGRPPKPKPDSEVTLTVLSSSDIPHHSKQQQPLSQATKMRFSKPKRGRGRPRTLRN